MHAVAKLLETKASLSLPAGAHLFVMHTLCMDALLTEEVGGG